MAARQFAIFDGQWLAMTGRFVMAVCAVMAISCCNASSGLADDQKNICPKLYHSSDVLRVSGVVIRVEGSFIIRLDHPLYVSVTGENPFSGIAPQLAVTGIRDWQAAARKIGRHVVVRGYLFAGRTRDGQDSDVAIAADGDPMPGPVTDCNGQAQ